MFHVISPSTTQRAGRLAAPLTALSAVLLLVAPAPVGAAAPAASQVAVRLGEHPGFARIVFDLPAGTTPTVSIRPGHVSVQFPPGTLVTPPGWMPPHVLAFTVTASRAEISVEPGADIKQASLEGRLVLDVLTPHAAAAPARATPAMAAPTKAETAQTPSTFRAASDRVGRFQRRSIASIAAPTATAG